MLLVRGYMLLNLSHCLLFFAYHKPSRYRVQRKLDQDPLAVEQNNYVIKTFNVFMTKLNVYISMN